MRSGIHLQADISNMDTISQNREKSNNGAENTHLRQGDKPLLKIEIKPCNLNFHLETFLFTVGVTP